KCHEAIGSKEGSHHVRKRRTTPGCCKIGRTDEGSGKSQALRIRGCTRHWNKPFSPSASAAQDPDTIWSRIEKTARRNGKDLSFVSSRKDHRPGCNRMQL